MISYTKLMKGPILMPLSLKTYFPKNLLGRTLTILITPLVLVQFVLGYVFFDRHTEKILKNFAFNLSGEISLIIDFLEYNSYDFNSLKSLTEKKLQWQMSSLHQAKLSPSVERLNWLENYMDEALQETLHLPYSIYIDQDWLLIGVQLGDDVFYFKTLKKRLFSRTTPLVLIWTTLSAILLLGIATIFMRNQIRPIRKLAETADAFGQGYDVDHFKPEGATEVRKAGKAFLIMKERLQRQLQERLDMLAGISHDLRTPLTRMKLQLTVIKEANEIKNLKEDVNQMQRLIESFLNFARGQQNEKRTSVYLYTFFHQLLKKIDLKKNYLHCKKNLFFPLKPLLFERCIENLLLNAKRHAQEVWIYVSLTSQGLDLIIEDNGPGIPKEEMENVFKPFYRLDQARNLEEGGTGLGLSIARDVIRSHGGDITLTSSSFGGLKVLLFIPI